MRLARFLIWVGTWGLAIIGVMVVLAVVLVWLGYAQVY
jgi:hypothetical protein